MWDQGERESEGVEVRPEDVSHSAVPVWLLARQLTVPARVLHNRAHGRFADPPLSA